MEKPLQGRRGRLNWRQIFLASFGVTIVLAILGYRLSSLPAGYSANEHAYFASASSIHDIVLDPIDAPHKLLTFAFAQVYHNPLASRLASATLAFGFIVFIFMLLRYWHNARTATIGTLILLCSAPFLHIARWGTAGVMQWTYVWLLLVGIWFRYGKKTNTSFMLASLFVAVGLYSPGAIWFVLAFVTFGARGLRDFWLKTNIVFRLGGSVAMAALLAPLGYALITHPTPYALEWLGLPSTLPSLTTLGVNLISLPLMVSVQGPNLPELWLGRLPLFDILGIVLLVIGVVYYVQNRELIRLRYLVASLVICSILVILSGPIVAIAMLPVVAIVIAAGIDELLYRWFSVFPHNPFARGFAILLFAVVVALSVFYNTRHYFVAWPSAPQTKHIYQL